MKNYIVANDASAPKWPPNGTGHYKVKSYHTYVPLVPPFPNFTPRGSTIGHIIKYHSYFYFIFLNLNFDKATFIWTVKKDSC